MASPARTGPGRSYPLLALLLAACSGPGDVADAAHPLDGAHPSDAARPLDAAPSADAPPADAAPAGHDAMLPPPDASPPAPACPDGACNGGETCATCAADCGACPPPPPVTCGNGACDAAETCSSCAADCAVCIAAGAPDGACTGGGGSGGASCGGISDAYIASADNVGYYPFVATRATTLYSGDYGAGSGGTVLASLAAGQGFAAQSTRNPGCSDNPPLRPAVAGFVFGYARATGLSGWIALADLTFVGYSGGNCADGPASADFEVAHNPYDGCRAMSCAPGHATCASANSSSDGATTCSTGMSVAGTAHAVTAATLYIRYAPASTAIHYLHHNDHVHVFYRVTIHGVVWDFVEVSVSSCPVLTPVGARGWTEEAYLD